MLFDEITHDFYPAGDEYEWEREFNALFWPLIYLLLKYKFNTIYLFAIWRKGLRKALPILKTLTTVGNHGNHLFAALSCSPAI